LYRTIDHNNSAFTWEWPAFGITLVVKRAAVKAVHCIRLLGELRLSDHSETPNSCSHRYKNAKDDCCYSPLLQKSLDALDLKRFEPICSATPLMQASTGKALMIVR
jgi:hypothetical protein